MCRFNTNKTSPLSILFIVLLLTIRYTSAQTIDPTVKIKEVDFKFLYFEPNFIGTAFHMNDKEGIFGGYYPKSYRTDVIKIGHNSGKKYVEKNRYKNDYGGRVKTRIMSNKILTTS